MEQHGNPLMDEEELMALPLEELTSLLVERLNLEPAMAKVYSTCAEMDFDLPQSLMISVLYSIAISQKRAADTAETISEAYRQMLKIMQEDAEGNQYDRTFLVT